MNNIIEKNKAFNIRFEIWIVMFILLVTLIAYRNVNTFDFINFDDDTYVINNPHVNKGITLDGIIWAFGFSKVDYWIPLTWLSYMIDCELYGLDPGMHHAVNLLFHIVNSILLFFVFKKMTNALWQSAFIAFLFAVHPVNIESVAWIAERKNVLSTFFWILAMTAYVKYVEHPDIPRYILTLFLFLLGMMAKPIIITFPFALLLLDYFPLNRISLKQTNLQKQIFFLIVEKTPFFIISFIISIILLFSLDYNDSIINTDIVPLKLRIGHIPVTYLLYLSKILFPLNHAVVYPYPEFIPLWKIIGALLILTFITLFIFSSVRRIPYAVVGWLWFMGILVPVSGIVQAGEWAAYADRYAYIPSIGIFMIIAFGVPELIPEIQHKKAVIFTAAVILISVFTIKTGIEVQHWKNPILLYQHAIETVGKGTFKIHTNLANSLAREGRLDEAILHYNKAIQINPTAAYSIHNNIGAALIIKGRYKESLLYLNSALKEKPDYENAKKNLEIALKALQKKER